jgi:predicted O-methyltransferase YrrM
VLRALGSPAVTPDQLYSLRAEVLSDQHLAAQYERHIARLHAIAPHKAIRDWRERIDRAAAGVDIFYVLPRILRPTIAVETGVASGSMTALLLAALHRNRHGMLHSFDLPPVKGEKSMDWTADPSEVGFLIPDVYKDRWSLVFGDATYELPKRFRPREIDPFFHDSDHTFEHMTFEYAFAAKHLNSGGVLISDDIGWNDAFWRFFKGCSAQVFVHKSNLNIGVAVPHQSASEF